MRIKQLISAALVMGIALTSSVLPSVYAQNNSVQALGTTSGTAYAVEGGNIYIDKGSVVGCDSSVTAAVIPAQLDGVDVTKIASNAFYSCSSLKSLVIPEGVKEISVNGIRMCSKLDSVSLPQSLEYIGNNNFDYCSLDSIDLPSNLKYIGDKCFGNNDFTSMTIPASVEHIGIQMPYGYNVNEVNVDGANPYYCSVDGVVFTKDISELVVFPTGKELVSYTVPDGVKRINNRSFYGVRLAHVEIPDSVTVIDEYAFGSSKLKSVKMPQNLIRLGERAFGSTNITEITMPDSLMCIGQYPASNFDLEITLTINCYKGSFADNTKLYNNTFTINYIGDSSNSAVNGQYSPEECFEFDKETGTITAYYGGLTEVKIPPEIDGVAVNTIGYSSFSNNKIIENVVIPDGVKSLMSYVFARCDNLTEVTMPDSLESISSGVFNYSGLNTVNLYRNSYADKTDFYPSGVSFNYIGDTTKTTTTESTTTTTTTTTTETTTTTTETTTTTTESTTETTTESTTETTTESTSESTTESTTEQLYIFGDADTSGILTSFDAANILYKALNLSYITEIDKVVSDSLYYLDVNRDGAVTASDATYILQKVLDSNFKMPCEK